MNVASWLIWPLSGWIGTARWCAKVSDLIAIGLPSTSWPSKGWFTPATAVDARFASRSPVQAPHGPPGAYPGTCRALDDAAQQTKEAEGRSPALRLRADGVDRQFADLFAGDYSGPVDDVVLARADGVPAYNLAVVVDDAAQQVDQVIRGDDLLDSTPRQIMLQQLLNLPTPDYGHVPLVVDAEGRRLAKRDEPVTARQLTADGWTMEQLVSVLGRSLGLVAPGESVTSEQLLQRFAPELVPREPMVWPDWLRRGPTG